MDILDAIEHAKTGNAILFTGAGFSYGAKNLSSPDNAVPAADKFADILAHHCEVARKHQLPAIAQYFQNVKGDQELVRVMLERFSISELAPHHRKIAEIPWRRVYTTNYDNCFELAAAQAGLEWTPVTTDIAPTAASKRCVHINGHISNLTARTLKDQVKLTHSSYSADAFANSRWSQQLRQDMNSSKAVFFVGYSMYDLDISRILYEIPDLKARTFFITSPSEDLVSASVIAPYGTVHQIGVEKFANIVESVAISGEESDYELTWPRLYRVPDAPTKPDDALAHDLILRGVVLSPMMAWSLAESGSYYTIRRTQIDDVVREVVNGRRWLVIHSDLGNGKSILKEEVSYVLSNLGYQVYWDTDFDLNKRDDINHLSKTKKKIVFMIDEDSDRFSTIDLLKGFSFFDAHFIIYVRSTLFQLGEKRYEDSLPEDFAEFDINRLTDWEVSQFGEAFDSLGLWGDFADLGRAEKENMIKVNFDRSIQKLIVSVFENSDIGRKIVSEGKQIISSNDTVASILILTFILNKLEHPPTPTIMSEILPGIDVWKTARSKEFKAAGEFIRFENGMIRSRSSILSNVLLRSAVKPEFLIDRVEKLVRALGAKTRNATMHHVFTQLMRFPTIEGMIDHPRKRELIIGYFQSIKDLGFCKNNADFWLHYAMARLTFGEFEIAAKYFSTAKSLAKGNAKKTTDVNNHFARLLLDSRIKTDDYSDYFKAFEMAHAILISQMNRDDNRHYPYRQAKKYVEFISFRKSKMTEGEIRQFVVSCRQVKTSIKNLTGKIALSGEIADCDRQMDRAIEIATSAT